MMKEIKRKKISNGVDRMITHNYTGSKLKNLIMRSYYVWSRFIPSFYFPYRFAGGKIYLDIKESRAMLARALDLYELDKYKAIRNFLPAGGVFIDVGANKGDFSLVAAKISGDKGTVLSFEPEPENCGWIEKSACINGYKNIFLRQIALSNENGLAPFYLGKKTGWHTLLPNQKRRSKKVIDVQVRTLDSLLKEASFNKKIDMIKIDVEGSEIMVLQGAEETLKVNKDIVLLVDIHPRMSVIAEEVCKFLISLGFSIFQEKEPFNIPVKDYSPGLFTIIAKRV